MDAKEDDDRYAATDKSPFTRPLLTHSLESVPIRGLPIHIT